MPQTQTGDHPGGTRTERRSAETVGARDLTLGVAFSVLLSVYLLLHIGGAVHLFG